MRKRSNKSKQFWLYVAIILLGAFGSGIFVGFTNQKHQNRMVLVEEILEEACHCEEVIQIIYATGVQFGENGITTEKGEYQLIDCEFTSIKEEGERLNTILNSKVKGFDTIDYLELEFVNKDYNEKVIIKNGKIQ